MQKIFYYMYKQLLICSNIICLKKLAVLFVHNIEKNIFFCMSGAPYLNVFAGMSALIFYVLCVCCVHSVCCVRFHNK